MLAPRNILVYLEVHSVTTLKIFPLIIVYQVCNSRGHLSHPDSIFSYLWFGPSNTFYPISDESFEIPVCIICGSFSELHYLCVCVCVLIVPPVENVQVHEKWTWTFSIVLWQLPSYHYPTSFGVCHLFLSL